MKLRGFTLLELVLTLGLVGLGILALLSVMPTATLALRRGEDLQAATACATRLLQEAQQAPPRHAGIDLEEQIHLNGTTFSCAREIIPVDPGLADVVVTVTWRDDTPPLRMATRIAVRVKAR